jgi:hypothetical protein
MAVLGSSAARWSGDLNFGFAGDAAVELRRRHVAPASPRQVHHGDEADLQSRELYIDLLLGGIAWDVPWEHEL